MTAMERKGKEAACNLINEMCGGDSLDVSSAEGQCECLIGAITVWTFINYTSVFFFFSVFNCFRMEMTIQYVMKLG